MHVVFGRVCYAHSSSSYGPVGVRGKDTVDPLAGNADHTHARTYARCWNECCRCASLVRRVGGGVDSGVKSQKLKKKKNSHQQTGDRVRFSSRDIQSRSHTHLLVVAPAGLGTHYFSRAGLYALGRAGLRLRAGLCLLCVVWLWGCWEGVELRRLCVCVACAVSPYVEDYDEIR